MKDIPLIFILYDGIDHSVFEGQVLAPLARRLKINLYKSIFIISFEQSITEQLKHLINTYQKQYPAIFFYYFKRSRFISTLFLKKEISELRNFLTQFHNYHLIARGPLASYIAQKAITHACSSFIIQARGLLSEEHSYARSLATFWKRPIFALRTWQLARLEKSVFSFNNATIPFSIESISKALEHYLHKTYNVPQTRFIPALLDIPVPFTSTERELHNLTTRKTLSIPSDAIVYAYNGSLKAWQCPSETIDFFKKAWEQDSRSFFLALTQDIELMKILLCKKGIPESNYRITHVPQEMVMLYLCAASYGFLLRKNHIINWVSRPTKLLEYQAAGLTILHNNTIALLYKPKA